MSYSFYIHILFFLTIKKFGLGLYYQQFHSFLQCCPDNQLNWQYIPYYPDQEFQEFPYWPHVRHPIHYYYFRPPLSYENYNPCPNFNLPCSINDDIRCCLDYCGQNYCQLLPPLQVPYPLQFPKEFLCPPNSGDYGSGAKSDYDDEDLVYIEC